MNASRNPLPILFLWILILTAAPGRGERNAPFPIRHANVNGVSRLLMRDLAAFFGMRQSVRDQTVHWRGRQASAAFTIDRRQAEINGTRVNLSHAVAHYRKMPMLSETDFRLLLDPILRDRALPRQAVRTIVIDPGHGGHDPGAPGSLHQEKEIVLQISQRLAAILRARGFRVHLTRNDDRFLTLPQRTEIARRVNADLMISVHANAAANRSVRGVETFLLNPANTAGTHSNRPDPRTRPGNAFDKQSMRLAYEVQRHILQKVQTNDRGTKHAGFGLLHDLPCPGVLVEVGFLSHAEEERQLGTPAWQARIALGIAEGVLAYRQAVEPR